MAWTPVFVSVLNGRRGGSQKTSETFTFLKLTMIIRIKEIIITAGGENVAPTNIEEEIKTELPEVKR